MRSKNGEVTLSGILLATSGLTFGASGRVKKFSMDSNSSSVYYWDSEDTDSVNVRKLDDKQADLLAENFSNSKIISIDYEIQGSMEKTAKAESQKSGDTPKGSNSVASNDVKFLSEDTQLEQSSFRIRAPENIHGIKFDDDEASDSAEGEEEEGEEAEERDCLPEAEGILPLRVKDDLSSSEDEGGDDDHGSMDSHIPIRGFSIREDIIMKRENEGSQDSDITTVKEKSLDGAILYQTERIVDREEPIRTGLRIRSSREDVPFSCDPLLFPGVPSSVMVRKAGFFFLPALYNNSF